MQDSQGISHYTEVPKTENRNNNQHNSSSSPYTSSPISAMELLRSGFASRGLNTFIPTPMPDSNTLYSSGGFPLQELRPTLSFPADGLGSRYGIQENSGRLLFPFGELKQLSSTTSEVDQNKGQGGSSGYWNGMFGGGSW
jgi:hypothetical protein